ncbi:hypothetical protein Gasu2_70510 [Galdieria sulphuraria]|nr:hypothetical protein Gasu2_70510 [Galdieria sulphuraria]
MKKLLFFICGAPGVDKLSSIRIPQQGFTLPDNCDSEDYLNRCRFSPYYFFLRHPEAGLGRFCKQVSQHLSEYQVAIVEDEQGDIPLLEEIHRAINRRLNQEEQVEVLVNKFLLMVTDFGICREGILKQLASSIRKFELTKDGLAKTALSKQILCQQLAQQVYADSVFISAWETSENREAIISLTEQNGYKSISVHQTQICNPVEEIHNNEEPTALFLFLSVSISNAIASLKEEQLHKLREWIPRESILVVLGKFYSETTTSISNFSKSLAHRLNRTVVGIQLWDGLWKHSDDLFKAGYILMSSRMSCPSIALVLFEPGPNEMMVDSSVIPAVDLESIMRGREVESVWQLVLRKWNMEKRNVVWECQGLYKFLDNWYLEHQGKCLLEICVVETCHSLVDSQRESQQTGQCISSATPKNEALLNINPACCNLLDKESIRHYASFHPKLVENAEQLLEKHRIEVLFPSSNEVECIMEASQTGSYYHVSFSTQDDPPALKETQCDCPYFAKQKKMQKNRFLFCKHILALMIRVHQLLTEQPMNEEVVDTWKEEKKEDAMETYQETKGNETQDNTLFTFSNVDDDVDKNEYSNDTPELWTVKPNAPRRLPAFVNHISVTTNAAQPRRKKPLKRKISPVETSESESESHSWEASGVDNKTILVNEAAQAHKMTSQQGDEMEQSSYPSKSTSNAFYKYLLFGDESDEEEASIPPILSQETSLSTESWNASKESNAMLMDGSSIFGKTENTLDIPSSSKENNASYETQPIQNVDDSLEVFLQMDKKPKRSIRDKLAGLQE